MLENYGPFARAFTTRIVDVPAYLNLLGLRDTSGGKQAVALVADLSREAEPSHIRTLLAQPNWREHLVAIVAVLVDRNPAQFADDLWDAFDTGSWVVPQLAVALHLVDPEFEENAFRRLETGCVVNLARLKTTWRGRAPFRCRSFECRGAVRKSGLFAGRDAEASSARRGPALRRTAQDGSRHALEG